MRHTIDDYNHTCEMEMAPRPSTLTTWESSCCVASRARVPFGQAKQCVVTAFSTKYLMSAHEVMANILHMAQNMEEDLVGIGNG
jgi:hypothetical protein